MLEFIYVVLFIIYAALFCFPAFMFVWNWDSDGPPSDLYGCAALVLGFPGTLLALLIKIPMWSSESAETRKYEKNRNEKAKIFADECRKYIKKINDSQTIKHIAQLVKKSGSEYDYLRVDTSCVYCTNEYGSLGKCIIRFKDLEVKDLSYYGLEFKDIPAPHIMKEWVETFKNQNKDIVGLCLHSRYIGDSDFQEHSLCLNECTVVGYAIVRELSEKYIYVSNDERLCAVFKKKVKCSDSLSEWN